MVKRSEDLQGLERMDIAEVDIVAFGRALTDAQISQLETSYRQKESADYLRAGARAYSTIGWRCKLALHSSASHPPPPPTGL